MPGFLPKAAYGKKAVQPSNAKFSESVHGSDARTSGQGVKATGGNQAPQKVKAVRENFSAGTDRSSGSDGYDRMFGPTKKSDKLNSFNAGTGGSNIVGSPPEDRLDNDTRHPLNGQWVKTARASISYNHAD